MNLQFEQGSKEWEALRARAKSDLYWFNSVVLGFANVFPLEPETHAIAHKFMEQQTGIPEIDEAPAQLLMWPRETGKSTCGTVGAAIQEAIRNPNVAILIANEKEELAADFLAAIKQHFETNDLLRFLFPEVLPESFNGRDVPWSYSRAQLVRETKRPEATWEVVGVGGTKVGKHFDLIICDDLIGRNAMENARTGSWEIMGKTNRWVNQLSPLLSSAGADGAGWKDRHRWQIRFIGTRWWNGDTYEHIMDAFGLEQAIHPFILRVKLPDGSWIQREVYRQGDLAVLKMSAIERGEAVFPKIWPMQRIEKERFKDPEFVSCNLLNDPTDASVRSFKDEWIRYWDWISKKQIAYKGASGESCYTDVDSLYKIVCVDPAFSTSKGSARTAIVVYAVDPSTGKRLVLDVGGGKYEPSDSVQKVVQMAKRWEVNRVYIELVAQQQAYIDAVKFALREGGHNIAVEPLKPGGRQKDMRIETLIVPFQNGDIYVHRSQSQLIDDEYRRYRPGAKYRDFLDVLAYAEEKIPRYQRHGTHSVGNAAQRAQLQLDTFRKRLGAR